MAWTLIGLILVLALSPFAVAAVRSAKRRPGGAVLIMGLLMAFGMNIQITPPPPPQTELVQREADDDEPKD